MPADDAQFHLVAESIPRITLRNRRCRRSDRVPRRRGPSRCRLRTISPSAAGQLASRGGGGPSALKSSCNSTCSAFSRATSSCCSGAERIEHRLARALRMDAASRRRSCRIISVEIRNRRRRRRWSRRSRLRRQNFVRRRRQPVAARRRHILDEGEDGDRLLLGQLADASGDQGRLDRRTAGRIDGERHGVQPFGPESPFQDRAPDRPATAPMQRAASADEAGQPHHIDQRRGLTVSNGRRERRS